MSKEEIAVAFFESIGSIDELCHNPSKKYALEALQEAYKAYSAVEVAPVVEE